LDTPSYTILHDKQCVLQTPEDKIRRTIGPENVPPLPIER